MKLNLSRKSSVPLAPRLEGLGQRALGALSGSLSALPGRLQERGWLIGRGAAAEAHGERLRDVLSRDRALSAPLRPASKKQNQQAGAPDLASDTQNDAERAQQLATSAPGGESNAPDRTPSPPIAAPSAAAPAAPAPSAAAAAASDERPQVVQNEPIRTHTMARLLAAQGYRARALAIYEELAARAPQDSALHAELSALRARSA